MHLILKQIKSILMYYNEGTIIYVDGEFVKAVDAKTDLYGQSLHYGYAVFEGIRAYQTQHGTRIFKPREHYERLQFSARSIHIPFTADPDELTAITYELLERNGFTEAYIRPLVFCPPNMGLGKAREANLVIMAWEWANGYLSNKMRIMTSSYQRPNPGAFHIEAKAAGHYVNSILASQEARDKGFDEGLLLDVNGFVAEGPGANIFYEKDGQLYTPPRGNIMPGITRATVFELCHELNISVSEKQFTPADLYGADAAFFCGTAAEIVELVSLDEVAFARPWEETHCAVVQQAYQCRIREKAFIRQTA
jgi:branched-chain amino acid aminotransferase